MNKISGRAKQKKKSVNINIDIIIYVYIEQLENNNKLMLVWLDYFLCDKIDFVLRTIQNCLKITKNLYKSGSEKRTNKQNKVQGKNKTKVL